MQGTQIKIRPGIKTNLDEYSINVEASSTLVAGSLKEAKQWAKSIAEDLHQILAGIGYPDIKIFIDYN